ncbi:hypothetical protein [Aquimarina rhabdastrellae]
MNIYISEIINKIKKFSNKLESNSKLKDKFWVLVDDLKSSKTVYIFRNENQLLISNNGKVKKVHWDYLGNDSILIESNDSSFFYRLGFLDENFLILNIDGTENYLTLMNEAFIIKEIQTLKNVFDFLQKEYIEDISTDESKNEKNDWTIKEYSTKHGLIKIHCLNPKRYFIGDKVFVNNQIAEDGSYDLDWYSKINVKDGIIAEI